MKDSIYCLAAGLLIMGGMWWKMFSELRDAQADVRELRAELIGVRAEVTGAKNLEERFIAMEEEFILADLELIEGRMLLLESDSRKFREDMDRRLIESVSEISRLYAGTPEQDFGRERAMWHAKQISFDTLKALGGAAAFVDRTFLARLKEGQR